MHKNNGETPVTVVQVALQINASSGQVWDVLADYGGIDRFSPHVSYSHLLASSSNFGKGALRQCNLADRKNYVRERVTDWVDGSFYNVDIYEGTVPMTQAKSSVSVKALGPTSSEAAIMISYKPKFGPIGWLMDHLMMKRKLKQIASENLAGLRAYVLEQLNQSERAQ